MGSNQDRKTLRIEEVHIFPSPFCPLGKIESQTGPGGMGGEHASES